MRVPASYPVLGASERHAMHEAIDSGWLTAGPINDRFELELAKYIGVQYVRTCNSGSSANLLATAALFALGHIEPGDVVRVPAVGFPTTVNPLILYGAIPEFVDVDPLTLCPAEGEEIDVGAHPLGNPLRSAPALLEDCCDALGSLKDGVHVGKAGLVGTLSFFPAHHITTGEGGAVFTNDLEVARAVESLRDWGRDCWCAPGQNNTCGMRFKHHFPPLPFGYDHKYTFTHLGFNLKMTEVQAACGVEQMKRLPEFVQLRRRNHAYLAKKLAPLEEFIELPQATAGSEPSWFGFHFLLRERGLRAPLQSFLADRGVDSRLVFAGNLARQPYLQGRQWRRDGELAGADRVLEDAMWVGCWPGLTIGDLDFVVEQVGTFFGKFD